jgi:L-threonylcarbamoyladenylate synthase
LGDKIDMILDGGPSNVGVESTVLDICGDRPRILRHGGVPAETIEALIGPVATGAAGTADRDADGITSPGMLKSHYAPRTPLSVYGNNTPGSLPDDPGAALLFFDGASRDFWLSSRKTAQGDGQPAVAVLSETGNILEAAARLFETLHGLDRPDIKRIHAQLAPENGLGRAINDRLKKGSRE